ELELYWVNLLSFLLIKLSKNLICMHKTNGLLEALENMIRWVVAFTDSEMIYDQL
ncbi:hypothetical protein MKW92_006861, partial [Papaver armeniacum]